MHYNVKFLVSTSAKSWSSYITLFGTPRALHRRSQRFVNLVGLYSAQNFRSRLASGIRSVTKRTNGTSIAISSISVTEFSVLAVPSSPLHPETTTFKRALSLQESEAAAKP
jgi:hypothetical protein